MTLIEWAFGIGSILIGVGLAAYFGDYRLSGLWIGFIGATIILFALALQIQGAIKEAASNAAPPPPFNVEWKVVMDSPIGEVFVSHIAPQRTVGRVRTAIYLVVTNQQAMSSVIDGYDFEGSQNGADGSWKPIPTTPFGADIFWRGADPTHAAAVDLKKSVSNILCPQVAQLLLARPQGDGCFFLRGCHQ